MPPKLTLCLQAMLLYSEFHSSGPALRPYQTTRLIAQSATFGAALLLFVFVTETGAGVYLASPPQYWAHRHVLLPGFYAFFALSLAVQAVKVQSMVQRWSDTAFTLDVWALGEPLLLAAFTLLATSAAWSLRFVRNYRHPSLQARSAVPGPLPASGFAGLGLRSGMQRGPGSPLQRQLQNSAIDVAHSPYVSVRVIPCSSSLSYAFNRPGSTALSSLL